MVEAVKAPDAEEVKKINEQNNEALIIADQEIKELLRSGK